MEALVPILGNIKDTATLVLLLVVIGMGYLHITSQRENREDRKQLMDLLQKQTEALNSFKLGFVEAMGNLKNYLSAITGKPLQ